MWRSLAAALLLSGCASTFTAFTDRANTSDRLDRPHDTNKINGYSGDRRLVYVRQIAAPSQTDPQGRWLICRESFAGALAARSGNSTLTAATYGSVADAAAEALTKVDERAPAVRLYEAEAADLCYSRAAGALTDSAWIKLLDDRQKRAFVALAGSPKPDPQTAQTQGADADEKKAKKTECLKEAGSDTKKKAACDTLYGS